MTGKRGQEPFTEINRNGTMVDYAKPLAFYFTASPEREFVSVHEVANHDVKSAVARVPLDYHWFMEDTSNYEKIKEDAKLYYHQIGKVPCPALGNDYVHFTAEGFNHLVFKGNRSERNINET